MTTSKDIGRLGENTTVKYLLGNGFEILERNYRYKRCEIDIIAKKDKCIHFIEVKIRKDNRFGYPESFVSEAQKKRIKEAAENFIYTKNWNENILFDIIAINESNENLEIFNDAF